MIRVLVDQNFTGPILDGLLRREPRLDAVHVRDIGMAAATDPDILARAARDGRVLLTHDRRTMPAFAHDRVARGEAMPGVFLVADDMPTAQAIDELRIAVTCLSADECRDMVRYFPL